MKGLYGNLTGAALYNARSILGVSTAASLPSRSSTRSLSRSNGVYKICAGDEDYLVQRSEMILHSHTIHVSSRDGDNDAFNTQQNHSLLLCIEFSARALSHHFKSKLLMARAESKFCRG
jgi:hypothetical protein